MARSFGSDSSSCIICAISRSKFLVSGIHRLVCVHPDQVQQQLLARIGTLSRWNNFVHIFLSVLIFTISSSMAANTRSSGRYLVLTSSPNPRPSLKMYSCIGLQGVNSTPHLARVTHANTFSRQCFVFFFAKIVIPTGTYHVARAMYMA